MITSAAINQNIFDCTLKIGINRTYAAPAFKTAKILIINFSERSIKTAILPCPNLKLTFSQTDWIFHLFLDS